ncbi:N-acetyllactosaminide 3-alpha-galactosyltransferase [Ancylostoma ceylanicum]|uniref:N-acetyllactosaminide 3-alpha-galactosyltransferase n=1 Tax=Ancylostoma ceylanicum TaxID=53326 RepID=A0A0D6L5X6_9BILA|nr:N-acetyllactosaminide 3-alpha-galactosyltransferase [Ancylostoma ceylanicum]
MASQNPAKVVDHSRFFFVTVPFRDRNEELSEFAPYLARFLHEQMVDHYILVMNQTDEYRFNRASLINVGWLESDRLGCDYMVMHDVDLLPLNPQISYGFPGEGTVRHISAPQYHPKDGDLNLTRVENLSTDRSNTFRHLHGLERKRDYAVVTKDQRAMKRKRDYVGALLRLSVAFLKPFLNFQVSGLNSVRYNITARRFRTYGDATVHVIDVSLYCDMKWTPYCKLPKAR